MDFIESKAAVDHRNGEPHDDSDEDLEERSSDDELVDDGNDYDCDKERERIRILNSKRRNEEISKDMVEAKRMEERALAMNYHGSTD